MSETLFFYVDDAIKYGEETAIVLGFLRKAMMFHDPFTLSSNGIPHIDLSQRVFEAFLPHKPFKRIKTILRKLHKLNVISIMEDNYYAVIN